MALGRAVRAIREEREISQVQLAEATGFEQSWISHVERGTRNPTWQNVARLAEGSGVGVAEHICATSFRPWLAVQKNSSRSALRAATDACRLARCESRIHQALRNFGLPITAE